MLAVQGYRVSNVGLGAQALSVSGLIRGFKSFVLTVSNGFGHLNAAGHWG